MKFYGKIQKGKVILDRIDTYNEYISTIEDFVLIQVEIKRRKKFRSLNQNALYWEWLTIISGELGYETEELHSTFKSMFLTDRSKKLPLVRSTTLLTTSEFTQYLNKIETFCIQELEIKLPKPEELYN